MSKLKQLLQKAHEIAVEKMSGKELEDYLKTEEKMLAELERYGAIEQAARKLHEKMLRIYESDEYKSVWSFYWSHAGNYKGESWQEEQSALATALNNPR